MEHYKCKSCAQFEYNSLTIYFTSNTMAADQILLSFGVQDPEKLEKITRLVNKYNYYNEEYAKALTGKDNWVDEDYKSRYPGGNPQLLDALFAGCRLPFAYSSVTAYTPEVEEDIKAILDLMPQSTTCIIGQLRCRNYVTPLVVACHNKKMPLHMIELLLQVHIT